MYSMKILIVVLWGVFVAGIHSNLLILLESTQIFNEQETYVRVLRNQQLELPGQSHQLQHQVGKVSIEWLAGEKT
ncbi:hypothetical protein QYF36_026245 [Acer negundo]|nr:hypothetical protein QYF36_026245 [Acer negundo]